MYSSRAAPNVCVVFTLNRYFCPNYLVHQYTPWSLLILHPRHIQKMWPQIVRQTKTKAKSSLNWIKCTRYLLYNIIVWLPFWLYCALDPESQSRALLLLLPYGTFCDRNSTTVLRAVCRETETPSRIPALHSTRRMRKKIVHIWSCILYHYSVLPSTPFSKALVRRATVLAK